MRDFQKALFGLSFSVQKTAYVITLRMNYSFTECQGLVSVYLVMFHDIKRLPLVESLTVAEVLGGEKWKEGALYILGTVNIPLQASLWTCMFVAMPGSTTFYMHSSKCL